MIIGTYIGIFFQENHLPFNPASSGEWPQNQAAKGSSDALAGSASDPHNKATGGFDYQTFYEAELEKKHKDK